MINTLKDIIIFSPKDIDLSYSPVRKSLNEETSILGAFNPGFTELPNGNLLMMVRVAEQLLNPVESDHYKFIRWEKSTGYVLDFVTLNFLNRDDPRKYELIHLPHKTYGLTSFSWLLPVELNRDGTGIIKIHYDKIIEPLEKYQEYGIEDPRITKIGTKYFMTACSVSSFRHSTILYSSDNGLDYKLEGMILDHQNKDMVLFPEKIDKFYYALTRPMGDHLFFSNIKSGSVPGPSICMARSPDLLHWKPVENFIIQPERNSFISEKLGAGANPLLSERGWLILFHGVEKSGKIGIYRTLFARLNKTQPYKIEEVNLTSPLLIAMNGLPYDLEKLSYVDDIVFTTGIVERDNIYIIASGERDLCCRITHVDKSALINFA